MIVLFGSRSRGEARSDSDHDLFLVIEGLPSEPLARQRTMMAPLLPSLHLMPERLAMIARTPEEVQSHLTSLVVDVCVDGQSLYGEACFAELRTRVLQAVQEIGLARQRVAGTWMWRFPTFSNQEWAVTWGDNHFRL
nr:nucleotidyltransferase domain-containing protein [Candidatus Chloroploca mongolica]